MAGLLPYFNSSIVLNYRNPVPICGSARSKPVGAPVWKAQKHAGHGEHPTERSLEGKVALVAGASRGIGRAIAERLDADGALVAIHFGRNRGAAGDAVSAITATGGKAFAVGADLSAKNGVATKWATGHRAGGRSVGGTGPMF